MESSNSHPSPTRRILSPDASACRDAIRLAMASRGARLSGNSVANLARSTPWACRNPKNHSSVQRCSTSSSSAISPLSGKPSSAQLDHAPNPRGFAPAQMRRVAVRGVACSVPGGTRVPIGFVVTAFVTRSREVGDLVPTNSGIRQDLHTLGIHVGVEILVGLGQRPGFVLLPELRAWLQREAVERDMRRLPRQQRTQGRQKLLKGLPRQREDLVGAPSQARAGHQVQGCRAPGRRRARGPSVRNSSGSNDCTPDAKPGSRRAARARCQVSSGVSETGLASMRPLRNRALQAGNCHCTARHSRSSPALAKAPTGSRRRRTPKTKAPRPLSPRSLEFTFDPLPAKRPLRPRVPPTRRSRNTRTSSRRRGRGRRGMDSVAISLSRQPIETACGLLRTNGGIHLSPAGAGRRASRCRRPCRIVQVRHEDPATATAAGQRRHGHLAAGGIATQSPRARRPLERPPQPRPSWARAAAARRTLDGGGNRARARARSLFRRSRLHARRSRLEVALWAAGAWAREREHGRCATGTRGAWRQLCGCGSRCGLRLVGGHPTGLRQVLHVRVEARWR
jgi:hypothetical protein